MPINTQSKIKKYIHTHLADMIDLRRSTPKDLERKNLHNRLLQRVRYILSKTQKKFSETDLDQLTQEVLDEAIGLGPIEKFLIDPEITEIMVNGPHHVYVEKNGNITRSQHDFVNEQSLRVIIERIVGPLGRRVDEASPMVDARLKDGSRVNVILPPLSICGPTITIRKFSKRIFSYQDLVLKKSATYQCCQFLDFCVKMKKNILIAGGTGSGKTTLLNCISNSIPPSERIITIEDAAELQLAQEHVISLESRPSNIEGVGHISIRDLLKNSLRMRPDRIVIGECRSGEALDMLQAMNTGHEGSMTTLHSNSPRDALARLETMVLMAGFDLPLQAIREQIANAVHLIFYVRRFPNGARRLTEVSEISGIDGHTILMQNLFSSEKNQTISFKKRRPRFFF